MTLYQINIFPKYKNIKNDERADIVITYTLKKENKDKNNNENEIDMIKFWVSDIEKENLEIIDHINKLYYEIIVNNQKDKILVQDIFRAYQVLYGRKKWKNYETIKSDFSNKKLLTKTPYNNYKEITLDYIYKLLENTRIKYIQKYNNKKES